MKEGLETAEDKETLDFVSICLRHISTEFAYNVDEYSSKHCTCDSVAVLRILVPTKHCVASRLEQRSNGRQDDDGENRQDNACPCVHGRDDGLDHDGQLRARELFGGGKLIGGGALGAVFAFGSTEVCRCVEIVGDRDMVSRAMEMGVGGGKCWMLKPCTAAAVRPGS